MRSQPSPDDSDDPATFWARSNARLGIEETAPLPGKRSLRPPVDFQCAVCGIEVALERWPRSRHEVICESCRSAMGSLLTGEDRAISQDFRRQAKNDGRRYEGLPEMTPEDREALADLRERSNLGNGRSANRRRTEGGGSGGGAGGGGKQNGARIRRGRPVEHPAVADSVVAAMFNGGGNGGGGGRGAGGRGGSRGGAGGRGGAPNANRGGGDKRAAAKGGAPAQPREAASAPPGDTEGAARRRRKRRRGRGEGTEAESGA